MLFHFNVTKYENYKKFLLLFNAEKYNINHKNVPLSVKDQHSGTERTVQDFPFLWLNGFDLLNTEHRARNN